MKRRGLALLMGLIGLGALAAPVHADAPPPMPPAQVPPDAGQPAAELRPQEAALMDWLQHDGVGLLVGIFGDVPETRTGVSHVPDEDDEKPKDDPGDQPEPEDEPVTHQPEPASLVLGLVGVS